MKLKRSKYADRDGRAAIKSSMKKLENENDVKEIRPASVELRRDEDGVVRSVCPEEIPRDRLPTLAEAMLGLEVDKLRSRPRPRHTLRARWRAPGGYKTRESTSSPGRPSQANRIF